MSVQIPERIARNRASAHQNFSDDVREHYRSLLRRLDWPANGSSRILRTLGVTSTHRKEGVSTVAAQLAATAASWGNYRVLLVDANLGRPTVHRIFNVDKVPGMADFLVDDVQLATELDSSCVAEILAIDDEQLDAAVQSTTVSNLHVLAAGSVLGNPAWTYDSGDVTHIVQMLEKRFDLVVFDMPAVGAAPSVIRLAGALDGVLLVVEAERIAGPVAKRTSRVLSQANAHLLGVVLNKRRGPTSSWM